MKIDIQKSIMQTLIYKPRIVELLGMFIFASIILIPLKAGAVEGASSFYLLGNKGSLAGTMAPAGNYFALDNYFYSGDVSKNKLIPDAGGLEFGVDADVVVTLPTALHVTDNTFLNGRIAYGLVIPVIYKDISVDLRTTPGGSFIDGPISEDATSMGDPVLTAILGWNEGNLHTTFNVLLNVPIGEYDKNDIVNAGFNRWGVDLTAAFTYLNPETDIELSAAPGITFNGENSDTDYDSGHEFHLEVAVMQHLSANYAVGINAYHYEQITNDSGTATSDFKGRVTAIGPAFNFNFQLGNLSVSGKAKYFKEYNVRNRLEGESAFLQFAIPL